MARAGLTRTPSRDIFLLFVDQWFEEMRRDLPSPVSLFPLILIFKRVSFRGPMVEKANIWAVFVGGVLSFKFANEKELTSHRGQGSAIVLCSGSRSLGAPRT
jgi:hypothetical protein